MAVSWLFVTGSKPILSGVSLDKLSGFEKNSQASDKGMGTNWSALYLYMTRKPSNAIKVRERFLTSGHENRILNYCGCDDA